jgi:small-conductance mechanosensitive channel
MQEMIADLLRQWNLHPFIWNMLLPAASLLIGFCLYWLLSLFVKKQTASADRFRLGRSLLAHLSAPVAFLLPLFLFNNAIPLLQMSQTFKNRITHATEIGLIICFAWLLMRFISVAQDIVHNKVNINAADNLRQRQIVTQLIYIQSVVNVVIIILTIGAVLLTFDTMRKIGAGLLTGVGIGGIIIGFAAQRSLANLLAGFQIAFTQPIRIDDEVIVEEEFGKVEELTLTYVVVRLWDNRRMILPINYFIENPFQNWTRTTSEILGTVYFYTDYSIPVDWVRKQFLKIIETHPLWDKRAAGLVVTDLKHDVMELRVLMSASSSGNSFDLRCYVREELIKRINEAYPQCLAKTRIEFVKQQVPNQV